MSVLSQEMILSKLKSLKPYFEKEDIKLLGLFGSYSTNKADQNSDIDILIETTPAFLKRYKGFSAFAKLDELRDMLREIFDKDVDIIDRQGLLQHKNTYIIDKAIYV